MASVPDIAPAHHDPLAGHPNGTDARPPHIMAWYPAIGAAIPAPIARLPNPGTATDSAGRRWSRNHLGLEGRGRRGLRQARRAAEKGHDQDTQRQKQSELARHAPPPMVWQFIGGER